MRILLVHNWYRSSSPSGENEVFLAEKELLKQNGHDIHEYCRYSDDLQSQGIWGEVRGGLSAPLNPFTIVRVRKLLQAIKPDVMHVHNTFPLISPAVFWAAKGTATATVMTLHNYRIGCSAGLPFRDTAVCMACLEGRTVVPALKHRCYRKSFVATVPLATMISLHRAVNTWDRDVDAFIALSEFQKDVISQSGLIDPRRIHIKPQFMANPPSVIPMHERENRIIFVGRMSEEKGVRFLLEAWSQWGTSAPELLLAGDGVDRASLEQLAKERNLRVTFLGRLSTVETLAAIGRSRLLVIPSICFEGFPLVVREALACGVPVAASAIGPLPSIVTPAVGRLFGPANAESLLHCVRSLWHNQAQLNQLSIGAREEFDLRYTGQRNHQLSVSIYAQAIQARREKLAVPSDK